MLPAAHFPSPSPWMMHVCQHSPPLSSLSPMCAQCSLVLWLVTPAAITPPFLFLLFYPISAVSSYLLLGFLSSPVKSNGQSKTNLPPPTFYFTIDTLLVY
jgi:hypothetical protein